MKPRELLALEYQDAMPGLGEKVSGGRARGPASHHDHIPSVVHLASMGKRGPCIKSPRLESCPENRNAPTIVELKGVADHRLFAIAPDGGKDRSLGGP